MRKIRSPPPSETKLLILYNCRVTRRAYGAPPYNYKLRKKIFLRKKNFLSPYKIEFCMVGGTRSKFKELLILRGEPVSTKAPPAHTTRLRTPRALTALPTTDTIRFLLSNKVWQAVARYPLRPLGAAQGERGAQRLPPILSKTARSFQPRPQKKCGARLKKKLDIRTYVCYSYLAERESVVRTLSQFPYILFYAFVLGYLLRGSVSRNRDTVQGHR